MKFYHLVCQIVLLIALWSTASGSWPSDPDVNLPLGIQVSSGVDWGWGSSVVSSDGKGGIIMAWIGDVVAGRWDIYAQWVDGDGTVRWREGGTPVCTADGEQVYPGIVPDGTGGAIVVWEDQETSKVLAQRIGQDGSILWKDGGVRVCPVESLQFAPELCPDGDGGAIVTWMDSRRISTNTTDIYAQRIGPDGNLLWDPRGVLMSDTTGTRGVPRIVPDGSGGAIVAWYGGPELIDKLHAQRIDHEGHILWGKYGVLLAGEDSNPVFEEPPSLCGSGEGGVIAAWRDTRSGPGADLYIQKISPGGVPCWGRDGAPLCRAQGEQLELSLAPDGRGGAFAVWRDQRSEPSIRIFAQRVSADGKPLWAEDGVPVSQDTGLTVQYRPALAPDGRGGVIVVWEDMRYNLTYEVPDIFAQKLDPDGRPAWDPEGVPVCTAENSQTRPRVVPDGEGGAIAVWKDMRKAYFDLYLQRILADGTLGGAPTSVEEYPSGLQHFYLREFPNPFNSSLTLVYSLPEETPVRLAVYDISGSPVRLLVSGYGEPGLHRVTWDGRDEEGRPVASGIYIVRLEAGGQRIASKVTMVR